MFTTADGRLKISFEHAHGYAADVTIRARKGGGAPPPAAIPLDRSFEFSKALFDLGPPESHAFSVTYEYLVYARGAQVSLPASSDLARDMVVSDVDTGRPLKLSRTGKTTFAELGTPITGDDQSARLRITGTVSEPRYRVEKGLLVWECTIGEPRSTILLPVGWDVAAVSVTATVTAQSDGRAAIQIYNGNPEPLPVTIRAVKR